MPVYISILRGINVNGQKLIKMDALRKALVGAGLEDLQTYIQSGNLVYRHGSKNTGQLDALIREVILQEFGHEVPVINMDLKALTGVVGKNPWLKGATVAEEQLHVTFLGAQPEPTLLQLLESGEYKGDAFKAKDQVLYLRCLNGYGRTKLSNGFIEQKLKVSATTRNWKTTLELLRMGQALQ
jgi:uncharacterized protein (DUF1697 family)